MSTRKAIWFWQANQLRATYLPYVRFQDTRRRHLVSSTRASANLGLPSVEIKDPLLTLPAAHCLVPCSYLTPSPIRLSTAALAFGAAISVACKGFLGCLQLSRCGSWLSADEAVPFESERRFHPEALGHGAA